MNGTLVIGKRKVITDPAEARQAIAQDVLRRTRQARSHFHVAPVEDRTWIHPESGKEIIFASRKEMLNHIGFYEQEKMGLISKLKRQVKYELKIGDVHITSYISDHDYFDETLKRHVVADSKGKRTETFIIKKRLMKLIYGIEVIEI